MKKITILSILALLISGCAFKPSELDEQLNELIDVKEFVYKHEATDAYWHVLGVESDSVYFSTWFDDNGDQQYGIRKITGEDVEDIINTTNDDYGVDSFVKVDDDIYYTSFILGAIVDAEKNNSFSNDVFVYRNGESTSVLDLKDERPVSSPELFVLNKKVYAAIQVVGDNDISRALIYNITDKKEEFSVDSEELSIYSSFIMNTMIQGLEKESLTFAVTREKDDKITSSIYTFDGESVKENVYSDIYIYDLIMVQGQPLFTYQTSLEEPRYVGYLNKNEDLVQTEIEANGLMKVFDIKEGAILFGSVGEGEDMYHYVKIDGVDISFESTSIFEEGYLKTRFPEGFVAVNNNLSDKTTIRYYTVK